MTAQKYQVAYGMNRSFVRTLLYDRQDGECPICEEDLPTGFLHSRHVNIDHKIPRSHGGPDTLRNIQLVHLACNLAKGASCDGYCPRCYEPEVEDCQ